MSENRMNEFVSIRASSSQIEKFRAKCDDLSRKPTDMMRELLVAFSEGRVKITPTEKQLKEKEIYNA